MVNWLLVIVILGSAKAEYTWTGTDWKWQNPVETKETSVSRVEGSGDDSPFGGDDTEYDDEDNYDYGDEDEESYNYQDNRQIAKNEQKKTHSRTQSRNPTFDDEDLTEGSGSDVEEDTREGSGGFSSPNWKKEEISPPRRYEPTIVDPPPRHEVGKVHIKDDVDDDTMYVDQVNYNGYTPRKEDVFFGGDNDREEDNYKNSMEVTTTTTTKKHQVPKPTESPGVHKEGPTNHRPVSFFAQPGILAAVIGGAVVGLLCAILLVMFIVYRMRKKDEGSYALDEPKRAHNANSYSKPPSREFYA